MTAVAILFLWTFAAATVLPLSSEPPRAVANRANRGWFSRWVILGKGARYLAVAWLTLRW